MLVLLMGGRMYCRSVGYAGVYHDGINSNVSCTHTPHASGPALLHMTPPSRFLRYFEPPSIDVRVGCLCFSSYIE